MRFQRGLTCLKRHLAVDMQNCKSTKEAIQKNYRFLKVCKHRKKGRKEERVELGGFSAEPHHACLATSYW